MTAKLWEIFDRDRTNIDARNALVEKFMPLVEYHAKNIAARLPKMIELGDLVSAGIFGLVTAIGAFDISKGVKFETFSALRIRGAILDGLRQTDWVPRLVRSRAKQLETAGQELAAELGRLPTEAELAERLDLSPVELRKTFLDADIANVISLHRERMESNSSRELREIDVVRDLKSEDPARRSQKADLVRLVTRGLNQKERLVVILLYYEELTMKEAGKAIGLTESRVSQIHDAILKRLRTQLVQRQSEFALV